MTNLTADAFNFDNMKETLGQDPFAAATNKYAEDERFYKLTKDKEGNGAAIIRFLPDAENGMIKQVHRIGTTIIKNGKKRFVNELSPQTIGQPCPFHEEWQRLWNLGDKEGSRNYGRKTKFITNIKVIKDPANPENEGKIFLFEMSGRMKNKIQEALNPSEQDRALGAEPKQLFNPIAGQSFKLASKKDTTGFITYDSSSVIDRVDGIYDSVEEAIADIKENTHLLSEFDKPESYLTYEKLQEKFNWVTFSDTEAPTETTVQAVQTVQTETKEEPKKDDFSEALASAQTETKEEPKKEEPKKDDLDDLLSDLM